MTFRVTTYTHDPEVLESGEWEGVWPEYNTHGDVMNIYWPRLYDEFPQFQFFLYDDQERVLLAKGHCAPCRWDGTVEDLPAGIDDVITEVFALKEQGLQTDVLTALAIVVPRKHQGKGLSSVMVKAMAGLAREHGFRDLIAPVRPNWKERYPITPIERYAGWRGSDGLAFDPWMRVHQRLGGEILKAAPHSLHITGSVAEWEEWTGIDLPQSGPYVFPYGLAPLEVDKDTDLGSYWEPNVWMRHRIEQHS